MYTKAKITFKNILRIQLFLLFCVTVFLLIGQVCHLDFLTTVALHKSIIATVWDGTTSLTNGSYYLNNNIKLMKKVVIASGNNVTLALNGYALTRFVDIASIEVQAGATLNIQKTIPSVTPSNTGDVLANTILDETNATSPFLVINGEQAVCNLSEKIIVSANLLATNQAEITASEVTFKKEITLTNHTNATFTAPVIENNLNILNGSNLTLKSISARKSISFTTEARIYLQSSKLTINHGYSRINIPNLQCYGDNIELIIKKCKIEKLKFENINKSNVIIEDSLFSQQTVLEGKENTYHFDQVEFGGQAQFKGDGNSFHWENIDTKSSCKIEAAEIQAFNYIGQSFNLDLHNVQKMHTFTYQQSHFIPQVNELVIIHFIVSAENIEIQGNEIDGIDYSNIKIENLTIESSTTAVLHENALLTDTKLFLKANADTNANTGSVRINYKMENEVVVSAGIKFDFSDNGSLEKVEFAEGAEAKDYQDLIDKGHIKLPTPEIVPDLNPPVKAKNLNMIAIILILSVILDMLLIWFVIIFTLKRNKK